MKLVNNLVLGAFMAALGEGLVLGEAAGLGRAALLDALADGGGASGVLSAKKAKLLADDWAPHFSCDVIAKDLDHVLDLAAETHTPTALAAAARNLFARAWPAGMGHLDFSAVADLIRRG